MPVDTKHDLYSRVAGQWKVMRDCVAGEDAVKAAAEAYLPKPTGMRHDEYLAFKQRASFHDATARTVDGLVGAVFRKPPEIDAPSTAEVLVKSVDGAGLPIEVFAGHAVREVVTAGRYGVLADVPVGTGTPYLAGYAAEAIINWRVERLAGRRVLTLVVLAEDAARVKAEDEFEVAAVERLLVLQLVDGWYTVRRFEKVKDKFAEIDTPAMPLRRGARLDFIPFTFLGATGLAAEPERPPLLGLATSNLSHYQVTADLRHTLHLTSLPTPVVAGRMHGGDSGQSELKIGSGVAWLLEQGASWGMMEFTGAGAAAQDRMREAYKQEMAALGARLLEDQKAGVEAAETVSLRHRGENSVLASIAATASRGLSQALSWAAWWGGAQPDQATIALNSDFVERAMSPSEMVQLVAAWQNGGIGGEALYHNLREGERLPEGWTFDDFQRDLEEHGPAGALFGPEPEPEPDEAAMAGAME